MRFSHLFETTGGLTLVALSLIATPAPAQTVISNETLVSTTFVVNKTSATAKCGKTGCRAKTPMFNPVQVTCPAANGQTCTLHISLDARTSISFRCGADGCSGSGPAGFYQFLVDAVAPSIGPTGANGNYLFADNVFTYADDQGNGLVNRQSYPASVLATVTNSGSNSHTIAISLGCSATGPPFNAGCEAVAHWSTMRVDVFEP
jgi:hypothetical protein